MDFLTPDEINGYDTQGNALRTAYGRQLSQNTYAQGQAGLDYGLGKTALGQKFDQQRGALPGQYVHRGLMNSGIYQQGLQDYAQQRGLGFQGLARQYDSRMGQLNLDQGDFESTLNSGLNSVESAKAARRATNAASLRGMV